MAHVGILVASAGFGAHGCGDVGVFFSRTLPYGTTSTMYCALVKRNKYQADDSYIAFSTRSGIPAEHF
jgi:hypothetical protein